MSKKPVQKKTPFVIEPLNWVAPEAKRNESADRREDNESRVSEQERFAETNAKSPERGFFSVMCKHAFCSIAIRGARFQWRTVGVRFDSTS